MLLRSILMTGDTRVFIANEWKLFCIRNNMEIGEHCLGGVSQTKITFNHRKDGFYNLDYHPTCDVCFNPYEIDSKRHPRIS